MSFESCTEFGRIKWDRHAKQRGPCGLTVILPHSQLLPEQGLLEMGPGQESRSWEGVSKGCKQGSDMGTSDFRRGILAIP